MELFTPPLSKAIRPGKDVFLPAFALVAIILADHILLPGVTIAPLCNSLALGVLALYLRPRMMVIWAILFTCSSIFMLNHPTFSVQGPASVRLTIETRSAGTLVGATIVILLCVNRCKAVRSNMQLAALVKRLPLPFVLSDSNGTLLFASEEAARLINIPQQEIVGLSYFELLMNATNKGATIQSYMDVIDAPTPTEATIDLKIANCPGKFWKGLLIPIELYHMKRLITVITPSAAEVLQPG